MIYIHLFIEFFRIGLFSFGGGYAMIPLISNVITTNQWMTAGEFTNIISIAEMTPGPIAVNTATYVGFKVGGTFGSVCATTGVAMPSLLIILFISKFFFTYKEHPIMKNVFKGIRPVIAGLILSSAIIIGKSVLFEHDTLSFSGFHYITFFITVGLFTLTFLKKLHPILLILIGGVLGLITGFIF